MLERKDSLKNFLPARSSLDRRAESTKIRRRYGGGALFCKLVSFETRGPSDTCRDAVTPCFRLISPVFWPILFFPHLPNYCDLSVLESRDSLRAFYVHTYVRAYDAAAHVRFRSSALDARHESRRGKRDFHSRELIRLPVRVTFNYRSHLLALKLECP